MFSCSGALGRGSASTWTFLRGHSGGPLIKRILLSDGFPFGERGGAVGEILSDGWGVVPSHPSDVSMAVLTPWFSCEPSEEIT